MNTILGLEIYYIQRSWKIFFFNWGDQLQYMYSNMTCFSAIKAMMDNVQVCELTKFNQNTAHPYDFNFKELEGSGPLVPAPLILAILRQTHWVRLHTSLTCKQ